MKSVTDSLSALKITEAAAFLVTVAMAVSLAWVLYLIGRGSEIPAVLWCGNTITDPLAFAANVLIPVGSVLYVVAYAIAWVRPTPRRLSTVTMFLAFIAVSVAVVFTGFHFCSTHLEGLSFRLFVWWM